MNIIHMDNIYDLVKILTNNLIFGLLHEWREYVIREVKNLVTRRILNLPISF